MTSVLAFLMVPCHFQSSIFEILALLSFPLQYHMRECLLSGGLVMSGGLLGFAFSRNLTSLSTGVLYGGALLALSTLSMKIWRQGKSSFPYILGQAGNFSFTFFMWTWMFIEMFLFMYESFGAYSFFGTLKMQCFQLLSSGRTSQLILWYFVIFVTMLLIV